MNDLLFARQLQAVNSLETDSFVDLARVGGLNPRSDFRDADLSGTDLRNLDLTAFDFTNARLDHALIAGAIFNKTVRPEQLVRAVYDIEFVVLTIGEHLLAMRQHMAAYIGPRAHVSRAINEALVQLADDPDRRMRRTGAYVADNSDLVRRRLSRPFREAQHTLRSAGRVLILFEPTVELDFDILDWVTRTLDRAKIAYFTLLIPQALDDQFGVVRRRFATIPQKRFLSMENRLAQWRGGFSGKETRAFSQLDRARELAVGYARAVANAQSPVLEPSRPRQMGDPVDGERFLSIIDGRRNGLETLAEAFAALKLPGRAGQRTQLLIREDVFASSDATAVGKVAATVRGKVRIGSFAAMGGGDAEFYVAQGEVGSPAWDVLLSRTGVSSKL